MQLFYAPSLEKTEISLPKEEATHISRVLRKSVGDTIHLTNGMGTKASGAISEITKSSVTIQIKEKEQIKKDIAQIHVAVAMPKSKDRVDWLIQKLTEIGIHKITPLQCQRSERSRFNLERAQKIAMNASKQSLRYWFPVIQTTQSFRDFILEGHEMEQCFLLHQHLAEKNTLTQQYIRGNNCTLVIGPEGDLSDDELSLAEDYHTKFAYLGKRRLRTETAALVAAAILMELNL